MENSFKKVSLVGIVGMLANFFLFVIKVSIGLITNSQSMISDALNSGGDIASSLFTFIGSKISAKPADEDHNLGHGKAEYIFSLLISILIMMVSVEQIIASFKSLVVREEYNFSFWLVVVCIVTIITKMFLYIYANGLYKKYNNILLKANAKDHINDCFLTTMTLISAICGYFNIFFIDGIIGILISLWIFIVGVKLFKDSYDILMDKVISKETQEEILAIVDTFEEIKDINHFNSTPVGLQYQVSLTIFVDGNLSTFESHDIANRLEKEITKLDDVYLAIIHVNPYGKRKSK